MLELFRKMLKRLPDGRFALRLPASEREVLAIIADQMTALLADHADDPSLRRLSPPAYLEDEDVAREAEYQVFVAGQLRDSRLEALNILRETAERTELTEEEVVQWMQALNSIRLVLGTRLDVSDDDDPDLDDEDPERPLWALYELLGYLLDRAVRSLGDGPPPTGDSLEQ